MRVLQQVLAVFLFECRRTLMVPRLLAALALALFPVGLVALVQSQGGGLDGGSRGAVILYVLLPGLTSVMCLLLWAVPAVHSEVEGRTWPYLAVRPGGRRAVLVGKYLTAVAWTTAVGWLSLGLAALVLRLPDPLETCSALGLLIVLSAAAYGALFILLGVVFLRRALVAAVAYLFLMEFVTTFVPAVIHQFTIQYHLRSLFAKWLSWVPPFAVYQATSDWLFSRVSAWVHVVVLLGFAALVVPAAAWILGRRELVKPEET